MKAVDVFFDAPPATLAAAAAVALAILAIAALIRALAHRAAERARRTSTHVDDFLVDVVLQTKLLLLVFPALYAGSRVLPDAATDLLRLPMRLSLIAQGAVWAVTVAGFALERYGRTRLESDPSAITTIRAFRVGAVIAVWIVAVLLALDNAGFDVTALVAGLGIGGVAIALATQNILADLFASLSIVVDKPFVVGDSIKVGEDVGVVQHIGLKTTRLRSLTGEELVVSNGDLLRSRVRNFARMHERRVSGRIGVTYDTTAELLERLPGIIRAIVEKHAARFDRAHFVAFGDSSLDIEFVYFVQSPDAITMFDTQHAVNLDIVRAFRDAGVEFAFPTRTVHNVS